MNIGLLVGALISGIFFFSSSAAAPAPKEDRRVATLEHLADVTTNLPTRAKADLLRAKYNKLFPAAGKLSEFPKEKLISRFIAADLVSFYSGDVSDASMLLQLAQELERRHISSPEYRRNILGALIKARMFEEARNFQTAHPELMTETLPQVIYAATLDLTAPTALALKPTSVERQNVISDAPYQVLIIAHPLCHFSRAAIRDIQSHPSIGTIFAAHATWLAPPERTLRLETLREWNAAHPMQSMLLTYRIAEWPFIESWALPTFYFFRDGELVTRFEGWPKNGNWLKLSEALDLVGAIPDNSSVSPSADSSFPSID